jgi:hypothetical protein
MAIINRWLENDTKVVFLASYPRSGNTWMRFMLCDIVLQMHGVETTTQLPVDADDLIPEFRCNSIANRLSRCPAWAQEPPTAFIKTHSDFLRVKQNFSGKSTIPGRDWRVIYVYRSPEDALVSLYHWRRSSKECKTAGQSGQVVSYFPHKAGGSDPASGIDAYCRAEIPTWMDHMSSYFRAADRGFPVFFVSYESMLQKPDAILGEMLRWLDVPHDGEMIERAVSNMQFAKLQKMERQEQTTADTGSGNEFFFRRGRSGAGRTELQESTLQEIGQRTAALVEEARQRSLKQSQEGLLALSTGQNGHVQGVVGSSRIQ